MSRKQFAARNNIGSVLTFQKSGSTSSFDPEISFNSSSRRVSWKLNNGTNVTQTAGNSITYTGFTSDTGIRTIEMRGNSFGGLDTFYLDDDNLYGNLNLTQLSGLGGDFRVQSNSGLTGITHVPSSRIFTNYLANNCNLTGNLNLPLSGLGNDFKVNNNPNLTGITHVSSSQNFLYYNASVCNLTGTLDLSPLTNLGYNPINDSFSAINLSSNPYLTNVIFPNSTQFFRNAGLDVINSTFALNNCNLGYVDFKPLSGATLVSGATVGIPRIYIRDNNMLTEEVNHILVDFSGNATYNPTGWSNINLNIGGTNDAPNSSSGGYNGIAAKNFLTGSPYNWIITTS